MDGMDIGKVDLVDGCQDDLVVGWLFGWLLGWLDGAFVSWIEVWYEEQLVCLLDDWLFDGCKDGCVKFCRLTSYIGGSVKGLLNSCPDGWKNCWLGGF